MFLFYFFKILVEVTGFEPMALRSRTVRASPCATPRYSYVITDSKNMQAILIFSEKYLFARHDRRQDFLYCQNLAS